jgi:hypothetical protein
VADGVNVTDGMNVASVVVAIVSCAMIPEAPVSAVRVTSTVPLDGVIVAPATRADPM